MQVNNIIPMLATSDMDASVDFYCDILGFEVRDKFESGGTTWWCELVNNGHALMITQHEVDAKALSDRERNAQTSVNLYVDSGIEDLHARLKARGVAVSDLRVTFYRIKEFDLNDPTGYTILIGQPTDETPTVVEREEPPF